MSTSASASEICVSPRQQTSRQLFTASEFLFIYAGILLYIWRWQFTFPHAWIPLLLCVIGSHLVRRENPRVLGLTAVEFRASGQIILPLALAIYLPLVVYGLVSGRLPALVPGGHALLSLTAYLVWCGFQQYLAQSYFHRRLMQLTPNRHLSSLLVALMFGAAHIPNPILMAATLAGGWILSEVFARHPNIWPLAIAQAAGGFLIGALAPAPLIHGMRVGPGYLFYGIR